MSSIARPPDPCLVAIILIVRSRAGPRFVFHYPPNPLVENGLRPSHKGRRISRSKSAQTARSNDSSDSDASGSTSDEDEEDVPSNSNSNNNNQSQNSTQTHLAASATSTRRGSAFGLEDHASVSASPVRDSQRPSSIGSGRALRKRGENSDAEDAGALSDRPDEKPSASGGGGAAAAAAAAAAGEPPSHMPWESLLGLPAEVWEKLLSPSRTWHKRRFEVGVNDLAFVGWPVFVREDGNWRKERRKKKEKKPHPEWEGGEIGHNESGDDVADDGTKAMAASTETLSPHQMTASESQRASVSSLLSQKAPSEVVDEDTKDSMTMFNVVFVLDPPLLEYSVRVREIYDNIIKKFAKALKWEQARTDYVWNEAQLISHLKEKAKENRMWNPRLVFSLKLTSSLQGCLSVPFTTIS